jgi:hypothetical protein
MTSHEHALGSAQTCVKEPMSKAGAWSFDTEMALPCLWSLGYNYPHSASVEGKLFSFFLVLPSPDMSAGIPNPSRSSSRGLRQSFSEQISDIKTKLVRALSSERQNPDHDGSRQYSQFGGESFFVARDVRQSRISEDFRQRGAFGEKPTALSLP